MIRKRKGPRRPPATPGELKARLHAAEDTLRALRAGEVDALVVTRAGDDHVVTLQGADLPYRILLDQMNAGALTLTPDGVIVYSNQRFADIVQTALEDVLGSSLQRFAQPAGQSELEALLASGNREQVRGEFVFRTGQGASVPIEVTFAPLRLDGSAEASGVIGVVVDATGRKLQDEVRSRLIEQVMTAQDEERSRIARELHDETGQSLTALLVGLRTMEGTRTIAEARELAKQLREVAAQTLIDVGRLARGLHPSILDDLGLGAAVARHLEEVAELHGISVDLKVEGIDAEPLPALVQSTVYRLLQESLTNIAKHARARRVRVRLVRDETTVELLVRDDGMGFEPGAIHRGATAANRGGLGLEGMRERAAMLGGALHLESRPGKGTMITARIPLRRA